MAENDSTRIENLKRKMYSRGSETLKGIREHRLRSSQGLVKTDWGHAPQKKSEAPKRRSTLKIFFISSTVFFVVALSYAGYLYFGGANVVSSQNIDIAINGPVSINGGDTLSLEIGVANRNATPLEVADLLVEYPDGTRDASDISQQLPRIRQGLGDIASGQTVKKTVSAVLFGEEHSVKDIKITVEYRVPGSNAIFYKESDYQVVINSAPLSVVIDAPKEANSGQDLSLQVTINSNSADVVQNVLLKASYPSGFSFKSSDPSPFAENSIWRLGDVKPGSSRTFTIRGTLTGEDLDTKVFHFETGIGSDKNNKVIATPFADVMQELSIKKSFIGLSIALNGLSDETISTKSGKPVRVDVTYTNNLLVPVSNVEIAVSLQGDALEKTSVAAEKGFYRSIDNTVIWDKSTTDQLATILPGGNGTVSFSLASKSLSSGIASLRNPQILLSASVKGQRSESNQVPEEIVASQKRTLQIESDVALNTRLLYYSGPFVNTGSVPPKAEHETTYTVIMTLTNGSNDLSDVVVTAPLPSYVRFIATAPGELISFSQIGGQVIWNAGAVKAGTGFESAPRQAAFQIGLTPSISQVGVAPSVVSGTSLSATDHFTNTNISFAKEALSTRLTSDSSAKLGDDIVVK